MPVDSRFFDEMSEASGSPRDVLYRRLADWLANVPPGLLASRRAQADLLFRRIGITFAVYGDKDATERLIPFDLVPRLIGRSEWARLEAGLLQRVKALNMFLADLYGPREVVRAGIVPPELIYRNPYFRPEMIGVKVPHDVYVHIAGIDVVRIDADDFYVLEDNARTPSGVSYMLENREVMMRLFPEVFSAHRVAPVENYPDQLLATLRSVTPRTADRDPVVVLLTPGQFNSAYYEHSFLGDKLGIELVEGRDLFVENDVVFMRTTEGPKRVDVIYRRLDDDFLDPLAFRPDSMLGVPGLMSAYQAGSVTLANAVGTGVSDDKAIYSYMPEIIRFYLGEEAKLKNVPTWRCREEEALEIRARPPARNWWSRRSTARAATACWWGRTPPRRRSTAFAAKLKQDPANFIAQPTLALSTCPTATAAGISPRHVDLRPFVLSGARGARVVPGGLTRVAMQEGIAGGEFQPGAAAPRTRGSSTTESAGDG